MLRKGTIASIRALVAALLLAPAIPVAAETAPTGQPLVTTPTTTPAASTTTASKRGFSIDPNG